MCIQIIMSLIGFANLLYPRIQSISTAYLGLPFRGNDELLSVVMSED